MNCGSCLHWRPRDDEAGSCEKVTERSRKTAAYIDGRSLLRSSELVTQPFFGCVLWEKKDEQVSDS